MVQRGNWSSVTAGCKFDHAGSVYGAGATATATLERALGSLSRRAVARKVHATVFTGQ